MAGLPVRINARTVVHAVVDQGLGIGGGRNSALEAGGQGGVKLKAAPGNDHFRRVVSLVELLAGREDILVVVTEIESHVLQIPGGVKTKRFLSGAVGSRVGDGGLLGGILDVAEPVVEVDSEILDENVERERGAGLYVPGAILAVLQIILVTECHVKSQ